MSSVYSIFLIFPIQIIKPSKQQLHQDISSCYDHYDYYYKLLLIEPTALPQLKSVKILSILSRGSIVFCFNSCSGFNNINSCNSFNSYSGFNSFNSLNNSNRFNTCRGFNISKSGFPFSLT